MNRKYVKTARPTAKLRKGRTDWYRIENLASSNGNTAAIYIYDEIGFWGVTAQDFIRDLIALDVETIDLHLNSPGGDVFDGIAIMNALRDHKATVNVQVDSLAASIASVIAMAGDTVTMARNSQMMIHEASGMSIGNAMDMRTMADLLDKTSDNIAAIYAERAGGDAADWRTVMKAETWYSAEEAVAAGLADQVKASSKASDGESPEDSWDLSIYSYSGRNEAPAPTPVVKHSDVEAKDSGDEPDLAEAFRTALQEVFA